LGSSLRPWLILALAGIIALVFWPSTQILYEKWTDTAGLTYTHGWLILLVCLWLVLRKRAALSSAPTRPLQPLACVALALAVGLWLLFYRGSIVVLEVPMLPIIFWLATLVAFGWAVARLLIFPAAFFYFAVPGVWYARPLQELTVLAMRGAFAITGPHASFYGDDVYIPNGAFSIEEGCSGLHFMIVGLAVAALYGEQQGDTWRTRLKLLLLMAVLAVLANWVRVYTVIEAGYLTDMQSYLVRVSHYGFGWCVFAVALFVFFWLASKFEAPPEPASPGAAPLPAAAPAREEWLGVAAACLIMLALPALSAGVRSLHPQARDLAAAVALDPADTWRASATAPNSSWQPQFAGADQLHRYTFTNATGMRVEALAVGYRAQRQGAKLVGQSSSLLGDHLESVAVHSVDTAAGAFRETEAVDQSRAHSLIWSRYRIGQRTLVTPIAQQIYYGANALFWQPQSTLLALRADCSDDCAAARTMLTSFIASMPAQHQQQ
jgi:EpsI family protein